MSFTTGETVRVVRSSGDVELNWEVCFTFMHGYTERTQVRRYDTELDDYVLKCPRTEMLAYWQNGGMARSTEEWQGALMPRREVPEDDNQTDTEPIPF